VVTDDFLRSLLERPELAPVPESCESEVALHRRLLAQPLAAGAAVVAGSNASTGLATNTAALKSLQFLSDIPDEGKSAAWFPISSPP